MIKNAFVFCLPKPLSAGALSQDLAKRAFAPIAASEALSTGFVPLGADVDLVHAVGGVCVGAVRFDKKTIPGSALKEKLAERCADIEKQQGYAPGRKQKKEIKERVIEELLPRILPTSKVVPFYLLGDYFVVDTTSSTTADEVLGLLARCVEPFPVEPLHTEMSPAGAMTGWIVEDAAPAAFSVDQEAEMSSSDESRASVRWKNQTIDAAEAAEHAKQGKVCVKLAMTWSDRVSFVLGSRGNLARIKPLDVVKEATSQSEETDAAALRDSELALMGGELKRLLDDLVAALGGKLEDDVAERQAA